MNRRIIVLAVVALAAALVALPAAAPAIVPPRDCGFMTVSGKKYQAKVDQISCTSGKRYIKNYLTKRTKPRGYRCDRFTTRKNRVTFQCANGVKVFLAIRR
jgi:hypothetical protein